MEKEGQRYVETLAYVCTFIARLVCVLRNAFMFFFEHTQLCSMVSRESCFLLIDRSSPGRGKRERKRESKPAINGCLIT